VLTTLIRLSISAAIQYVLTLTKENNMPFHNGAHLGTIIRIAIVFNAKNWLGDAINADSLLESVEGLFALLAVCSPTNC